MTNRLIGKIERLKRLYRCKRCGNFELIYKRPQKCTKCGSNDDITKDIHVFEEVIQ